ncbi:TIGR04066 family peptide maturation system protein [Eisenbergiella porci]|uniref:TIGR04066 family peptide maturation system protein n=1 Tax=Eisenbergiella porci TaxID=2652274 RepID=UPI002A7F3DBC|nr:TIGR04066 family peptide maturation system protein [Eisenbergiella porci]
MKEAVLYPFLASNLPIIKYNNFFNKKYRIKTVVSPSGTGICGKDISLIDNRDFQGITVEENLIKCIHNSEALFVPWGNVTEADRYKNILQYIRAAIKIHKDIICNIKLKITDEKEIKKYCRLNNVNFLYSYNNENYSWLSHPITKMHVIPVPVIFVGGIVAEANNFEIVLSMTKKLISHGFKVTAFGMRPEYNLYGFHYNSLLMDFSSGQKVGMDIPMAISLLNHQFYRTALDEKPDAIIVEVPGGMLETPLFPNDCGVMAYMLTKAIQPDFVVGTFLGSADIISENIYVLNNEVNMRYGFQIDCAHYSNKSLNLASSIQKHRMEFYYKPINELLLKTPEEKLPIPVYCLIDDEQMEKMVTYMLRKLS